MFGMNVEWDNQQPQGHHHHHRPRPQQQQSSGGFFNNIFGGKKEEDKKTGHVYYYSTSSSRPSAPRRAETISVLPAGVKMPTGDKPEISYAADGTKYLVIPPRRSNSTRQAHVTSGPSTPKRKDSTASRTTPRRSNSTQVRPTSPPVASRPKIAPKIVGDPELVKHSRTSGRARRTSTR